jgi:NAD(P)-dependent dehydrogenase (short-subunit alcohol dehydrogenase family)
VIINFLDAGLRKTATGNASYYLSKKALMTFTEIAALELAPHIRVNGIAPGLMVAPVDKPADYEEKYIKTVPLGRIPSTKNITDAVMTLIENDYLTGQIIYLDGGKTL